MKGTLEMFEQTDILCSLAFGKEADNDSSGKPKLSKALLTTSTV